LKRYYNATEVLPAELLEQVQQYVQGVRLYIPIKGEPAGWGVKSGTRAQLAQRNAVIRTRYAEGAGIETLAREFFLSHDRVRKIIGKNG
jgi:Mor family transcriptional regulator